MDTDELIVLIIMALAIYCVASIVSFMAPNTVLLMIKQIFNKGNKHV